MFGISWYGNSFSNICNSSNVRCGKFGQDAVFIVSSKTNLNGRERFVFLCIVSIGSCDFSHMLPHSFFTRICLSSDSLLARLILLPGRFPKAMPM